MVGRLEHASTRVRAAVKPPLQTIRTVIKAATLTVENVVRGNSSGQLLRAILVVGHSIAVAIKAGQGTKGDDLEAALAIA